MAKGYWVVNLEVTDTETYKQYQAFVRPFLAANDGRFLIRGGQEERRQPVVADRQRMAFI